MSHTEEQRMENYFTLGPTPRDESCACVGEDDYTPRARAECRRFMALLRKKFGEEPAGARLAIKRFPHDFGEYLEVVVWFDEDLPDSAAYAVHCDDHLPATWDDDAPVPVGHTHHP